MKLQEAINYLCSVYLRKDSTPSGFCIPGTGVPPEVEHTQDKLNEFWKAWEKLYQCSDMAEDVYTEEENELFERFESNINKLCEFVYKPKPGPKEKIEFNTKNCPDFKI